MDVLKLVPQVFFDLIARMIPGGALLLGLEVGSGNRDLVSSLLALAAPNAELQKSAIVWLVVMGSTVYALGHLMAPIVRLLEKRHETIPEHIWEHYDWLRLHRPEAGALVARIRAEYTMYGGFSVAFLLTAVLLLIRTLVQSVGWAHRVYPLLAASGAHGGDRTVGHVLLATAGGGDAYLTACGDHVPFPPEG